MFVLNVSAEQFDNIASLPSLTGCGDLLLMRVNTGFDSPVEVRVVNGVSRREQGQLVDAFGNSLENQPLVADRAMYEVKLYMPDGYHNTFKCKFEVAPLNPVLPKTIIDSVGDTLDKFVNHFMSLSDKYKVTVGNSNTTGCLVVEYFPTAELEESIRLKQESTLVLQDKSSAEIDHECSKQLGLPYLVYPEETLPAVKGQLPAVRESATELIEGSVGIANFDWDNDEFKDDNIIEGTFREIIDEINAEEEAGNLIGMDMGFEVVPNLYVIDELGNEMRYPEDMSAKEDLTVMRVNNQTRLGVIYAGDRNIMTAKFKATYDCKSSDVYNILEIVETMFGVPSSGLIDVISKDDGAVVLGGQLCLLNAIADIMKIKIKTADFIALVRVLPTAYVIVKMEESSMIKPHVEYREPSSVMFAILDTPDELLVCVPCVSTVDYKIKQIFYIAMLAVGSFTTYYGLGKRLYLPPWSGNYSANVWLPVFKEFTLAYFGKGNRDRLYRAISRACRSNNIRVPAAAFMCPVEFVVGANIEVVTAYLNKLFSRKRPLEQKDEVYLKDIKKAKDFDTVFTSVEKFVDTGSPYPITTLGLYANSMQDIPMFKDLASCSDPTLMSQLLQECAQVLYRKQPKALASILSAHRSDLNDVQKNKAIEVIKKNI